MSKTRRLRIRGVLAIGHIVEIGPDYENWVVTSIEPDPDAIWALTFNGDTTDDEPEANPETVIAVLVQP